MFMGFGGFGMPTRFEGFNGLKGLVHDGVWKVWHANRVLKVWHVNGVCKV